MEQPYRIYLLKYLSSMVDEDSQLLQTSVGEMNEYIQMS